MIKILPEPKHLDDREGLSQPVRSLRIETVPLEGLTGEEAARIAELRFWNYPELLDHDAADAFTVTVVAGLGEEVPEHQDLFEQQGYVLEVLEDHAELRVASREGLVNGLTTFKALLESHEAEHPEDELRVPLCRILDHPSLPVRAVAPTMSWYAGYGRLGFDMQLWGKDEWLQYLQQCLDNKINQMNVVMYGYWPFDLPEYPETVFRDVPMKIWSPEVGRFIDIRYSHPNVAEEFLPELLETAHLFGVKILAYVGLNSYNGGWTIAHPEKRMVAPESSGFLNDFDSVCLSDEESVDYILHCMRRIAELGFDGYTLEESEEGFWFCECSACQERWRHDGVSPGEAKHRANLELLLRIREEVLAVNPDLIIGIRAFRQPPLEKDPVWLQETADSLPDDVVLFWAPALYVPETEFPKWVDAFGPERIWARDTESNSITSTMGRLFRIFESNMIRYEDEPNVQTIERDIEQHLGSVEAGVHGINGYMFEWHGLFMHQWAHGNYGWGSRMPMDEFFVRSCEAVFGSELGPRVLRVLQSILTIHESQIPLYTTPFPFQTNTMRDSDIPRIEQAIDDHPALLEEIRALRSAMESRTRLRPWVQHFDRLENAERRNRVIYDLVLAALDHERAETEAAKEEALDRVLEHNERDFDICKEMFFDLNPVGFTGVRSCMMPYHEMRRLIHNLRNPEQPDDDIICSGIEALGWLWLAEEHA